MRLSRVKIQGYRSIRGTLDLAIDRHVTVLLGANDHGKSNILRALRHLNSDFAYEPDDLNWDATDSEAKPRLDFFFELGETDRQELLAVANRKLDEQAAAQDATTDPGAVTPAAAPAQIDLKQIPTTVQATRKGLSGRRTGVAIEGLPKGTATEYIDLHAPRVELVRAFDSVPDKVTVPELGDEAFEFMQGLFLYAGITADEWPTIFTQDEKSGRRLVEASKVLNKVLHKSWKQGAELEFSLAHHSALQAIELRIQDPSVGRRFVRASQRSNGFTHFFALKTVLFARQASQQARSYIWLFDEPGIYLHPAGQQDLLQALEAVAERNQIVYSTHSIFLINRNYPVRHRLVLKAARGTQVDAKPFSSRWSSALDALGLALSGTILFATHVLITEGDSEPILLYALLQKAIALQGLNVDINPLAIIGSGDARNADVLIRLLEGAHSKPRIAILLDGDRGGSDRLASLRRTIENKKIPVLQLAGGTTIEDHLPLLNSMFVEATARYLAGFRSDQGLPPISDLRDGLQGSFDNQFHKPSETTGVAEWARKEGQRLGDLESPPSSVGIAREYSQALLDSEDVTQAKLMTKRPRELVEWIARTLDIPKQAATEGNILVPADDDTA